MPLKRSLVCPRQSRKLGYATDESSNALLVSRMMVIRSGWGYGYGRNSVASIRLKSAVLAPMASASAAMAARAYVGARRSDLRARRTSCQTDSIGSERASSVPAWPL